MPKALHDNIKIFGIRHHGPGSARRLIQALDAWQADHILIEFPADAQKELMQLFRLQLEPPVALVIYEDNKFEQALYYPFAHFSPEWQAIQWAIKNSVTVDAMDLGANQQMALRQNKLKEIVFTPQPQNQIQQDPLGFAASLAGYDDSEQWWDLTFEQNTDDLELFEAINELMRDLRAQTQQSPETLIREAFMRKTLRKAIKEGHERIAIVCGAWHAPALEDIARFKVGADNKILKGLAKTKVKSAWIPWSYPHLVKKGGYGAGVSSPQWYEFLFDHAQQAPIHWMISAAQLLRSEGMDVSVAHAQEAVRLAQAIAAIRSQVIPKLDDLDAAALSALCNGEQEKMQLIAERLIEGQKVGKVPSAASKVPLQADLDQRLKSTRLNKYWGTTGEVYLKKSKQYPRGKLDLRSPSDLAKSHLLHQVRILDIPWGKVQDNSINDRGAFKEIWQLKWQPTFSFLVLKAAMWGNTVKAACRNKINSTYKEKNLLELAQDILTCLKADLSAIVPNLSKQLSDKAALSKDIQELLNSLPPIIQIIQYGDARKTDVTNLALLLEQLVPRLTTSLVAVCSAINEEEATKLMRKLLAIHQGLNQLKLPLLDLHWWPGLATLTDNYAVAPIIRGMAVRLLFDKDKLSLDICSEHLQRAVSYGNTALEVANWLAGFLQNSGLLLLHHHRLWQIVDQWIDSISMDELQAILPLLRRTFASFKASERQALLQKARKSVAPAQEETILSHTTTEKYDAQRAATLIEGIHAWIQ